MFWDLPRFGKSGPAFRLVRIRPSLQRPWQDLQPEAAGNWLYKGSNLCIISYSSRSASTKAVFPAAFSSLAKGKEPEKVERQLRAVLPPEESSDFCHRLVLHGRAVCTARNPKCAVCSLAPWCTYVNGAPAETV